MDRREFLAMTAALLPRRAAISGRLGEVRLCRVSEKSLLDDVRRLLGRRRYGALIVEWDAAAEGAVLLGSKATFVWSRAGSRWYPSDEV